MSQFCPAVRHTFGKEGGFTGEKGLKGDSGGPTNMGVTLATLKRVLRSDADLNGDGVVDWKDVRDMPLEVARDRIYRPVYWDRPNFSAIRSQTIATKAFDLGVHAGPQAAIMVLQRAVNEARPAGVAPLKIDGVIGPKTLVAIALCDEELLISAFCAEQAAFYLAIIAEAPEKAGFRRNWLARARWPLTEGSAA